MVADKPMKVSEEVKSYLDTKKKVDRESYDSVLRRLLKIKLNISRKISK